MPQILIISLVLVLIYIFYQDIKYRAVSWHLFPIVLVISIAITVHYISLELLVKYSLINVGVILFQITCLTVYFSLRLNKFTDITKTHLGWGDILFFICISPLFSPVNFIVFLFTSTFIALLVMLVIKFFSGNKPVTIPLAGILSLILVPLILQLLCKEYIELNNDIQMIKILNLNV